MPSLKQYSWGKSIQSYDQALTINQYKKLSGREKKEETESKTKQKNTWPEHQSLTQAVANSMQFDFKTTTLRTLGNNLLQHK